MHFNIIKFGGGCLRIAEDVISLLKMLKQIKRGNNVIVVSAFYGMTNTLMKIVESASFNSFIKDFLEFHKSVAEDLKIYDQDMREFFAEKEDRAKFLLNQLRQNGDADKKIYAEIVAMGEDFSQAIVFRFLKSRYSSSGKVHSVDARKILFSSSEEEYVDVSINEKLSRIETRDHFYGIRYPEKAAKIFVIQGFLAGHLSDAQKTSLMKREGSDLSAAYIASFLNASVPGVDTLRLTFVKRFPEDTDKRIHEHVLGLAKFVKMQEELGVIIVSPEVAFVDNLPASFSVVSFEEPEMNFEVTTSSEAGSIIEGRRRGFLNRLP